VSRRFAFVFVCEEGDLEIKSSLLAASLRRHLRCEYELIAALPGGKRPGPAVADFLSAMGTRFVPISNEIDPTYPIANKIDCLRVRTDADKLVFLDSDMVLMRDFADELRFDIAFNARPASCATFSRDDADWRRIHEVCNTPMPTTRIRTTHSGEYTLPYFNAAFVGVPAASGFGDAWLDCCKRIDKCADVPNRRPYLDQIALGAAAAKLGLEMDCLDERYNHPINFKPMNERELPFFCHYHDAATLSREPAAVRMVQSLASEHAPFAAILRTDSKWANLLDRKLLRRADVTPELIITGIPRSGTSLLVNLLHRLNNCVVVNEPPEAPEALMRESPPWGLATFFRDIRRDVLEGKAIRNKLDNGKPTQDTAIANEFELYHPRVAAADFVLGIKATIAFLTRLPDIRRAMPNARFVACVRDPLDTIASWKGTFSHLREADVRGPNVGNPNDPWISGGRRKQLLEIANIPEVASRRAAWWAYLAGLILENREHLILVRYEDVVAQPRKILDEILSGWPGGNEIEPIEPSQIRRRNENLDAADIAAARSLCSAAADALGIGWRGAR